MFKAILSAAVISGSLLGIASLAHGQTPPAPSELDSEKSVTNHNIPTLEKPVIVRINPQLNTQEVLVLPRKPRSEADLKQMIAENEANFKPLDSKLVAQNDADSANLAKGGELDHDGQTPSWFRYGGNFGGYRGGYFGGRGFFGRGYGWSGLGYYNTGFAYNWPGYWINGWGFGNYIYAPRVIIEQRNSYIPYAPCWGASYGGYNYAGYGGGWD